MYFAVGIAGQTMSIRAASITRRHAAMYAGWSGAGEVVIYEEGQNGHVGGCMSTVLFGSLYIYL